MNLNDTSLEEIVATDTKGRYSFNEDKTLIRANQGHSIPVDVELEKLIPPDVLYHGTAEKYEDSIDALELISKSRLYVHLSKDIDTAKIVGKRHGKSAFHLPRQEVAFLGKARKIKGCGSLREDFYTRFIPEK